MRIVQDRNKVLPVASEAQHQMRFGERQTRAASQPFQVSEPPPGQPSMGELVLDNTPPRPILTISHQLGRGSSMLNGTKSWNYTGICVESIYVWYRMILRPNPLKPRPLCALSSGFYKHAYRILALVLPLFLAISGSPGNRRAAATGYYDRLLPGQILYANQSIYTGESYLIMQGDGNLVHYEPNSYPAWYTNTFIGGARLEMQTDGNLVMYSPTGQVLFQTQTNGWPGTYLKIRPRGDVVLVAPNGAILWDNNADELNEGTYNQPSFPLSGYGRALYYWNGFANNAGGLEHLAMRAQDLGDIGNYICVDTVFDWHVQQPWPPLWHRHYDSRVARNCSSANGWGSLFEWNQHHDWIDGKRILAVCRYNPFSDVRGYCTSTPGTVPTNPGASVTFLYNG